MNKILFIVYMIIFSLSSYACGDIIKISPNVCKQGINQPLNGDFAVFVFCDDGLGTQIGIILTKPGVGKIEQNTDWSITNRFWQEGLFMTDVIDITWSHSKNYLYVTTSEVYSDGSFYELDLRKRIAKKVIDRKKNNLDK